MIETFYIAAYWDSRSQDVGECAESLLVLLRQLRKYDPVFGQWYLTGKTYTEALESQLSLDEKESNDMLVKKCVVLGPRADGGFRFSLWNGLDGESTAGITATCGSQSTRFSNSCILTLPYSESISRKLLLIESICHFAVLNASVWKPQWFKVSSQKIDCFIMDSELNPKLGWATFSNGISIPEAALPPSAEAREAGIAGSLIFASPDAHEFINSGKMENLKAIDKVIKRARLKKIDGVSVD